MSGNEERTFTIGGRTIALRWTVEAQRAFRYRLGLVGGFPSNRELGNPRTNQSALLKLAWALLPKSDIEEFPDPESLAVAMADDETLQCCEAVAGIFADMAADKEKKTNSQTSPSPESNSD